VYDSLLGAPLAGATVVRRGAAAVAFTDSAGRFALAAVPARAGEFVLAHPGLDSAGLADLARPADLSGAPDTVDLVLGVPARATLLAALCPAADRAPDPARGGQGLQGVVYGTVRDASTDAALAADVTATWLGLERAAGRLRAAPALRTARADGRGVYTLCGVPTDTTVDVRAAEDPGGVASGRVSVLLGARGVRHLDLWVDTARPAAAEADVGRGAALGARADTTPDTEHSARSGAVSTSAVLTGVVRDTAGVPRAGARISLEDVPGREAVTDTAGVFTLGGLPAGTRTAVVRALGFAPLTVLVVLRPGVPARVEVRLAPVATLAAVEVRAQARHQVLMAAVARRQRMAMGRHIDVQAFQRHGSLFVALQSTPCLRLARPQSGCVTWDSRCWVRGGEVYVDGRRSDWCSVESIPPAEIEGVEVFAREEEVPPEYIVRFGFQRRGLLALVWTRSAQ
jgi:hypothetical protein